MYTSLKQKVSHKGETMSKQPRDDGNDPIPVLGLRQGGGHQVPFTDTANTSPQISASVRVITLHSNVDCFIETGDSTVTANTTQGHFLPASIPFDISLGADNEATKNARFVSVVSTSAEGILHISERE